MPVIEMPERVAAFPVIFDQTHPINITHKHPVRRDVVVHSCIGKSMLLDSANPPYQFRLQDQSAGIERAHPSLPNFLARDAQNRAHPRPRQWLWLAGGGCASCPLLQRLAQSFFPFVFHAFLAENKKRRSAPSSTAFRHSVCSSASPCLKPAIETANERGFDQHEGNLSWQTFGIMYHLQEAGDEA